MSGRLFDARAQRIRDAETRIIEVLTDVGADAEEAACVLAKIIASTAGRAVRAKWSRLDKAEQGLTRDEIDALDRNDAAPLDTRDFGEPLAEACRIWHGWREDAMRPYTAATWQAELITIEARVIAHGQDAVANALATAAANGWFTWDHTDRYTSGETTTRRDKENSSVVDQFLKGE